jgi:MGT family glycosyltransferase
LENRFDYRIEATVATVMAYTAMSPGHLYPFIAVMRELRMRTHEVVFAVNGPHEALDVDGIPLRCSEGSSAAEPLQPARHSGRALDVEAFASRGEPLAAALEAHAARLKPDYLLIDPMWWGASTAAEASGLPWATIAHNPVTFRGVGVDIRGPGLLPPRGLFGRLRYRALWFAMRANEDAVLLNTINAVRGVRHLPLVRHARDIDLRPPLILATTAEPFEYPRRDWPEALRFVGTLSWEPTVNQPKWVQQLDRRPVVLICGPTIPELPEAEGWPFVAMRALAHEPFQVIATLPTGPAHDMVPANARVERFIPHSALLGRAVCVICHGGWGITQKALAQGVPVVAIPHGYDRFEVARRLEVSGAGVMIPGSLLTPNKLRSAVREAMTRKEKAVAVARIFRTAGGAAAAADAIEDALSRQPVA